VGGRLISVMAVAFLSVGAAPGQAAGQVTTDGPPRSSSTTGRPSVPRKLREQPPTGRPESPSSASIAVIVGLAATAGAMMTIGRRQEATHAVSSGEMPVGADGGPEPE
jgi:hypothetical protein